LAYERDARFAGESKYTFSRLIRLALDGIINFSYRPLQLITFMGLSVALAALVLVPVVVFLYFTNTTILGYNVKEARGWTSIVLILLFSSAVQLVSLGILGEYIGRLYEETKQRPIFLVRQRINFQATDSPS